MSDDGKKDQDESDGNPENEDDTLSYYHKSTIYIPAVTQTSTSMTTEAEPKKDHKETVYIDNRLVREKKNVFSYSSVNDFVEKNIKLIDIGIYGLGLVGLVSIFHSIRLFSKFHSIYDIPQSFLSKNIRLQGRVQYVVENGVAMVDHTPIIALRKYRTVKGLLPVRLAGLRINEAGQRWLESRLESRQIRFTVLHVNELNQLECIMKVLHGFYFRRNINKVMIDKGYADVAPITLERARIPPYLKFHSRLIKRQEQRDAGSFITRIMKKFGGKRFRF